MVSESEVYESVWRQFGGAVEMLRRAIEACPDELWERHAETMGYWFLAYHTLFFVGFDLHPADEPYSSPPFDRFEYELQRVPPPYGVPYAKGDLLAYLEQTLQRVRTVVSGLRGGDSVEVRGSGRLGIPALEVVLYELRHVQHHAAQLNAWLRREGVEPPGWVRRGEGELGEDR